MGHNLLALFDIPALLTKEISLDTRLLPKQLADHTIRVFNGGKPVKKRAVLTYGECINQGTYGMIMKGLRDGIPVAVKIPKGAGYSLCQEALVQHVAYTTLEAAGIHGAVSRVIDIFDNGGDTRFSMEEIKGVSALQYFMESPNPIEAWFFILSQVAFILGFLEETLELDHRDLKATNIWIKRDVSISYKMKIGGDEWRIQSACQVVLLDFGFSCIGKDGIAVVNVAHDVFPKLDPCPKEGRDIFQFIISMWSIKEVRDKLPPQIHSWIEEILKYKSISYSDVSQKMKHSGWSYLVVGDAKFSHPVMHPISILRQLASLSPSIVSLS